MLIFLLLVICLSWSIAKIFKTESEQRLKYVLVLLSLIGSIGVWFLMARMDVPLKLYYFHLSPKLNIISSEIMNKNIELVEKGTSTNKYVKNRSVYKGGITSVYVDDKNDLKIFFQINSGYGYITGYVYSKEDLPLNNGDFGADFSASEKLENNWYIGYLD